MELLAPAKRRTGTKPQTPGTREQFLLFRVGEETYGLGLRGLRQVLLADGVTLLPSPSYQSLAVLAYRSRRIPVIRMNALFGVPEAGVPSMARVLLTIGERVALGLLVDEVLGLTAVDPSRIAPLPGLATLLDPRFFRGLFSRQNRVVLVVSEAGLAGLDEVSRFCEENP